MKLFENLKKVTKLLEEYPACWAICGGIAACLYRSEPRYTGDIDIAITNFKEVPAREIAELLVKNLNYEPIVGFIAGRAPQASQSPALILGREDKEDGYVGIDFLLPVIPWIEPSVVRAQHNLIDYGFANLPTITPEDLIIAKLFAIQHDPTRPYDIDDIRSIIDNTKTLDRSYIYNQVDKYSLVIPESIQI